MKLSIIGAGRVGQTLGRLARTAGYEIGDVVCRTLRSANRAVKFIGAGRAQALSRTLLSATDILFISTPDDKIGEAVELIRQSAIENAVALHTSGALSSEVLLPLKAGGFAVGSCHPLQSFATPEQTLLLISKTYFCIEGEARAVRQARRFVRAIGARYFEIPTERKSLYHAAAVMASGGVTALVSGSLEMLARCGLSEKEAKSVLLPLVEGTLKNIGSMGAAKALTGPISRGDAGTVRKNMQAIAEAEPQLLELYRLLAERCLKLAEDAGVDKNSLAEVQKALQVTGCRY